MFDREGIPPWNGWAAQGMIRLVEQGPIPEPQAPFSIPPLCLLSPELLIKMPRHLWVCGRDATLHSAWVCRTCPTSHPLPLCSLSYGPTGLWGSRRWAWPPSAWKSPLQADPVEPPFPSIVAVPRIPVELRVPRRPGLQASLEDTDGGSRPGPVSSPLHTG